MTVSYTAEIADLTDAFEEASVNLRQAQTSLLDASLGVTAAKQRLEDVRIAYLDPERTERPKGNNKEEREAWVDLRVADEREALAQAEYNLAHARHTVEQERVAWDLQRYLLRCLELGK